MSETAPEVNSDPLRKPWTARPFFAVSKATGLPEALLAIYPALAGLEWLILDPLSTIDTGMDDSSQDSRAQASDYGVGDEGDLGVPWTGFGKPKASETLAELFRRSDTYAASLDLEDFSQDTVVSCC